MVRDMYSKELQDWKYTIQYSSYQKKNGRNTELLIDALEPTAH
jgi:hypothetical protein